MKRLFYTSTLLLILFTTIETNAQIQFGLFGGANFADLKSQDNVMESITLFTGGILIEYNLSDEFSLIAQPMYLQKGGRQPENDLNPELEVTIDYLELPLMLKYKFNLADEFKPYLVAGGTIGYRLNAEMKAEINMVSFTADLKDVSKSYDAGITMGGGIEIPTDKVTFFVEGKYILGLIDVHKNGTFRATGGGVYFDETFTDDNWFKTKDFQIAVGMKINLTGK